MSIGFGQGFNADVKFNKMCALCKYWDDPTQEHAEPSSPGHWNVDPNAMEICLKDRFMKYGKQCCPNFSIRTIFLGN